MIVPDWLNVDNTIYQKINDEYGQALWGLRLSNLDHSWGEYSLSAVKVAIIDSGIDYKHEDFDKTILPGYNFLDRNEDVNDHWAWILGNVTRIPRHELPQTLDFSDFLPLFT